MDNTIDLKKTINLPKTGFGMKANLPSMEPRFLQEWEDMDLYGKIQQSRKGRPRFILHDGPPYANGHIHLGHALNKLLKDFIVKSRTMEGYDCPYVPGWDCHGLPIEIKVLGKVKQDLDFPKVRQQCRQYAQKFVGIQKEEFKRLGIFGDWDHPYLTMNRGYEAETARLLGSFVENGSVYKGLKPVHWCITCETALAEAEIEYGDHTSLSVFVKFPVTGGLPSGEPGMAGRKISVLIWTTTPWTLPANLALAFHPELEYAFLEVGEEIFILARDLVESVAAQVGFSGYRVLRTVRGKELSELKSRHPWLDQESKTIFGDHVTLEQGTGVVHTAPGHGEEDYGLGIENRLEIYCPVSDSGHFHPDVLHFAGLPVFEANRKINDFLSQKGMLLAEQDFVHSYPHCWRCHNPVIFRATPQWFISMDHEDLRARALREISKAHWIPAWGEERISNMVGSRPDWCISRQRVWGVPITVFYCRKCSSALLDKKVIDHVANIFEVESADAWYTRSPAELLPEGTHCTCGSTDFRKETDILDVWFDSGVSHHVVLRGNPDLAWPADVYLEGGDQYRGWFHSSLLVAVGVTDAAPYRTVICNGWTLDEEGRAMSKSLGNVISPLDIMKQNGAEILRLWVASIDYTEDVRLGEEILSRLREAYRKLRNTHRFLLGNLHDFDPGKAVSDDDLTDLDRWALARMAIVAERVENAYKNFELHLVYQSLYHFSIVDLSSFYLDILKDRLYISAPDSTQRRSAQTALFQISDTLVRLLAPILPFTSEEVWRNLYSAEAPTESVHMAEFSTAIHAYRDDALLNQWERLIEIRGQVSRTLEIARQNKEIGNSLQAKVTLSCGRDGFSYLKGFSENLASVFIVSDVVLEKGDELSAHEVQVRVDRSAAQKCERCWNYLESVGTHGDLPGVCSRCYSILRELGVME